MARKTTTRPKTETNAEFKARLSRILHPNGFGRKTNSALVRKPNDLGYHRGHNSATR